MFHANHSSSIVPCLSFHCVPDDDDDDDDDGGGGGGGKIDRCPIFWGYFMATFFMVSAKALTHQDLDIDIELLGASTVL